MLKIVAGAILASALATALPVAHANDYPSRPITLVAPFPPGGSTDVIARLFANKLSARLNQNVVVENKPGANGGIGAAAVARAKPDGYTLLIMGASSFTINPLLYKNLAYDPQSSYDYLGIAGGTQLVVLTNQETGLSSIKDMVSRSATSPLSYGSFGTGSLPQIAGEYLAQQTGAKLLHVPYRGSSPAMADLIGNQIPLSIDTMVASLPQIRGGRVKPLAVSSAQRSAFLPDVPTMQESGVPDYDFQTWFGLVSPKGTPQPVIDKLSAQIRDMMADKDMQKSLQDLGFDARFADPQGFRKQVADELARNAQVIKSANISTE